MSTPNTAKRKYNQLLSDLGAMLRIDEWTTGRIVLSNGIVLEGNDYIVFKNRCRSQITAPHLDDIYASLDSAAEKCVKLRAANSRIANRKFWENLHPAIKEQRTQELRAHIARVRSETNYNVVNKHDNKWNKGKTKDTDDRLKRISEARKGDKNPMFGTTLSEEAKRLKSELVKQKILSGEWTPHVHNSRTHWECSFRGKKFRSSWEAMYASINPDDIFEKIRIAYTHDGSEHIYVVDFVNETTKTLTEIKPLAQATTTKVMSKLRAAEDWCNTHGYTLRIISEDYFVKNFNKIPFDELCIPNLKNKISKIKHEASKQN
jgi:hypothetical protein